MDTFVRVLARLAALTDDDLRRPMPWRGGDMNVRYTLLYRTLTLPSQWGDVEVHVRFRLHRFASHLVEHTVQCERALEAAGAAFGDARRVVRRISVARAMHERISLPELLGELDAMYPEA